MGIPFKLFGIARKRRALLGVGFLFVLAAAWAAGASFDPTAALSISRTADSGEINGPGVVAYGFTPGASLQGILCGDVHPEGGGNGVVNVLDALRALKMSVALVIPTPQEKIAADVHPDKTPDPDGDGDVDVLDALRILKASVALVNLTSCGGVPPEPLALDITSPAALTIFNSSPITVSGTVLNAAGVGVAVNWVAANVTGGTFTAQVPLKEGNNTITAVASDAGGNLETDSIQVTLDSTPPTVNIDTPEDGQITADAFITVAGMINDIVVGAVNGDQASVTVNGVAAAVANRSFLAADMPLALGQNTITAVGVDKGGNTDSASITVIREDVAGKKISLVSGNNQAGPVGSLLPLPLIVELDDGQGNKVSGVNVIFKVTENNGALSTNPDEGRALVVPTDAQGRAEVDWKLGTRAGAGNNMVEAAAVGFSGKATFTATALPLAGQPEKQKINVDAGGNQTGVVSEPLPSPFVAVVTDEGHNRLQGILVTFTVINGDGSFAGNPTFSVNTDSDGRGLAVLTLGPSVGIDNNLIEATFQDNPGFPATFLASGQVAGNPADTRVSGLVLDNSNVPIPGVTMRLLVGGNEVLNALTDQQGQFTLGSPAQPAPVGHVMLIADASTIDPAVRPGEWPNLEFELVTVVGQDNTIGMPVFLLPLDMANGIFIDEQTGGMLTLPGVPGFSLNIAPGSATFPDGSKSGTVTVTLVHNDKIPMVPNFGQQPRFIVTIQPAGVHFDPPAPITIPNVDSMAPGEVTEMYSFDHDMGQFVSIGTGTVTEDGTVVASDPGVGIIKGGWHCGGNPNQAGSTANLTLSVSPAKITVKVDDTLSIIANGRPPLDGVYSFQVIDGAGVVMLESVSPNPPNCKDSPSCTAIYKALKGGKAKVRVKFTCTTTGDSISTGEEGAPPDVEITVIEANLDIDGVDEANEEDPGGLVGVNAERKKIILKVVPEMDEGEVQLTTNAPSKIEIWDLLTEGTKLTPDQLKWQPSGVPPSLFVKGIKASDAPMDVELTLTYTANPTAEDKVKFTVFDLDLIGKPLKNANWNGVFSIDIDTAPREEITPEAEDDNPEDNDHDKDEDADPKGSTEDPGLYVGLNSDDDNRNRKQDFEEDNDAIQDKSEHGRTFKEDDLQRVEMELKNLKPERMVTLEVKKGTGTAQGRIKIWKSRMRGPDAPLLDGSGGSATVSMAASAWEALGALWVEGVELSRAPKDVLLRLGRVKDGGGVEWIDTIDITVVGVTVQKEHSADKASRTQKGFLRRADEELLDDNTKIKNRLGRLHVYVYSPVQVTDGGDESDIDTDIYSYDNVGLFWQDESDGSFKGVLEEFSDGSKTSQDEVEPDRITPVDIVDQEFLTASLAGFYIVNDKRLFISDIFDTDPDTVVGVGGGRVIVRVFEDLRPVAGIRPPGWLVNVPGLDLIGKPLENEDWNNVFSRDFDTAIRKELSPVKEDDNKEDNEHDGDTDINPKPSTEDPGLYVGFNADDDNRNRKQDFTEGNDEIKDFPQHGKIFVEDDLQRVEMELGGVKPATVVKLEVKKGTGTAQGRIKVWESRKRGPKAPLLDGSGGSALASMAASEWKKLDALWIEGVELSKAPKDILLRVGQVKDDGSTEWVDTIDITVVGTTVQNAHNAAIASRTQFGAVIHADQALLSDPSQIGSRPGGLHVYVYSPIQVTNGGDENDIDLELFSYDRDGRFWQDGSSGSFKGIVEEFGGLLSDPTSQDEVEPERMTPVGVVDQEFLTNAQDGFYIVNDKRLFISTFSNTNADTVVGQGGGRVIARVFEDLLPKAGIRPPGWLVNAIAVELVKDKDDDNTIDENDPTIDHAQVGHWGKDAGGGVDGYTAANVVINNAPPNNFIDKDPERFYVRIFDIGRNAAPGAVDTFNVRIGTLTAGGAVDDNLNNIQMNETGNDTGVFVSQAQLLMSQDVPVADNPDDNFLEHDGIAGAIAADDAANDRTHRVTIDGSVRVDYPRPGFVAPGVRGEIPHCQRDPEERRVLNVKVFIFNEPWQDTNGDGKYTAGEPFMDISAGAAAFGLAGAYGPIWTNAQVNRTMTFTSAYLASACIRVVELARGSPDPTGTLFLHTAGFFDDFSDDATGATPSRDEAIIQANNRSAVNLNADDKDDIVDLYFVAPFTVAGSAFASQFRPGFVNANVLNVNLINQVHIGFNSSGSNVPFVTAHELMHQLANRPDSATPNHIFFPSAGGIVGDGTTVTTKRRMTAAIAEDARRTRANMAALGNKLLREP